MGRVINQSDTCAALRNARTQTGATLAELSRKRPHLLLFLRHLGCSFCREALSDIAARRAEIEQRGIGLAVVHMGSIESARPLFARYELADLPQVSDPSRALYQAFGLKLGNLAQLFSPQVWRRDFDAAFRQGHGMGWPVGNPLQMPGVFLIHNERIMRSQPFETIADRPDYVAFAEGPRDGTAKDCGAP